MFLCCKVQYSLTLGYGLLVYLFLCYVHFVIQHSFFYANNDLHSRWCWQLTQLDWNSLRYCTSKGPDKNFLPFHFSFLLVHVRLGLDYKPAYSLFFFPRPPPPPPFCLWVPHGSCNKGRFLIFLGPSIMFLVKKSIQLTYCGSTLGSALP